MALVQQLYHTTGKTDLVSVVEVAVREFVCLEDEGWESIQNTLRAAGVEMFASSLQHQILLVVGLTTELMHQSDNSTFTIQLYWN